MNVGHRIMLTFAIVVAMLFALALCGYEGGRWEVASAPSTELYEGLPLDKKLLELDKVALDDAYHAHTLRLWSVLMSDGGRFTDNFKKGMRLSRETYQAASKEIAKREQLLQQLEGR